ncbi:hypothetical protein [Paenibacillus rigui]|uniref:Nucleoside 2-deoxyribosyltransferase n=1 Tax=Paenibacillus rigui TaxID=554312 RepID=A0A229UMQ9_9BACL|nr:hypothetical protein [Paenibacillus rigui]OXM84575.1 hypothetical protein CF651_18880 [Paenibacillus rigui]
MNYHVIAQFHEKTRYYWNYSKDSLVDDLLIPLIQKDVRIAKKSGVETIFNFGAISYFTVLATKKRLSLKGARIPNELKDRSFIQEHNITSQIINEVKVLTKYSNKSILQYALMEPLDQIFVVMKFGDEVLDLVYKSVIKPLGEEFGYKVLRVDEIQDSGFINQQTLENISKSKIVIADLTMESPNCYYEAGFAHALGKEIVFCIKKDGKVHFDLSSNRFIEWRSDSDYREKLTERLKAIREKQSD